MKTKHRIYWRLNLMSLFFIILSFISVTLAWFAYSGLSNVSTDIDVKAWYITLEKDGASVSNDIIISLSDIYPGMETINEVVEIKNLGDSDAKLKYSIISARVLGDNKDEYLVDEEITSEYVEDQLSHEYPFHINIGLSKGYVLSKKDDKSIFEVSISWPLDSDNDEFDSLWGNQAYNFQQQELDKRAKDADYQIRPSIQVIISVSAEQYMEEDDDSDPRFNLGDEILYDVESDQPCDEKSATCLQTYVIDVDSKLSDDKVNLLPKVSSSEYTSGSFNSYSNLLPPWEVETRELSIEDLLYVISSDVKDSILRRNGISDVIIGNLNYNGRISQEIEKVKNYDGYYSFDNFKFSFLPSTGCYWTNSSYNNEKAFAVGRVDEEHTKIYGEVKNNNCKIIPLIIVDKAKFKE